VSIDECPDMQRKSGRRRAAERLRRNSAKKADFPACLDKDRETGVKKE
jgi:hypothetical protein